MFRTLLAHPQEALQKRYLVHVYYVRVMVGGCTRIEVELVHHVGFTILIHYDARSTKH
jgi:hypothetical protein